MIVCNFEGCSFNKEHFCTKETTIIKNANGIPVCEILVLRDGSIGANQFINRKTRDIVIEEGQYEQFTEDTTGSQAPEEEIRNEEEWDYNEIADAAKFEEMFDT